MQQSIKGVGVDNLKRFIDEHPDWLVIDHSQLEKWETCPRRYKYEYVDRLTRLTSYDAEFGNVLHKLLGAWYVNGPGWSPDSNFQTTIWEDFREAVYNASPPPQNRLAVFTMAHAIRAFVEYTNRYHLDFEAYDVVTSEEVYFRELLPGVLWISKPDLVLQRKGDQQRVTLDFKHSVWDFNRSLLGFDRQFVGQSYAAESKWMIKTFFHSQVPQRAGTQPGLQIYRPIEPADGELLDEWLEETKLMIKPILEARETGVYAKRAPKACMDFNRLCEFSEFCNVGKKAAQLMIESREKVNPNEYLGL